MITGKHNILIAIGNGQLGVHIIQDTSDYTILGDEFHTFRALSDTPCKELSEAGLVDFDNRCLSWG